MKRALISIFLLLTLLCSLGLAQNHQSANFSGSQEVSITVPNASPYNAITDSRFEWRINAWTGTGQVLIFNNILCNTTSTSLSCTDFIDAGSPGATVTLDPTKDYLIRLQRQVTLTAPSTKRFFTLEAWLSDGTPTIPQQASNTGYGVVTVTTPGTYAGTATIGKNGGNLLNGKLAWFRWFSTVVAVGSQAPVNTPGGDLLDLEFEGGVTDSSAHALSTSVTAGSLTYSTTPIVPLFVYSALSTRASVAATIDASPTNAATYFWQQTSGADTCKISSRTVAAPTISNCILFGEHDFQVTVTDSTGASNTGTIQLGVVPTNSSGVVVVSDAGIDFKLGPLYRYGLTPWTWYDLQQFQMSNYWYGDPANSKGSPLCVLQQIATGCLWTATMTPGTDPSVNYYDAVLVNYQMYYRTGLTAFRTRARALALQFWAAYWSSGSPSGGCGTNWTQPRQGSAGGLLLYEAETGDTSMYSCVDAWISFEMAQYLDNESYPMYTTFVNGSREPGYAYLYGTMEAQRDPTNATYHWLARITSEYAGVWAPFQCPNSPANYTCINNVSTSLPAGTVAISQFGTAIVGASGANFTGLVHGQRVWINDGNPSGAGWNWFLVDVVTDATHMTIQSSYPYNASSGGVAWAVDTLITTPSGAFTFADPAWPGYGEQAWHTTIAMEGIINYHKLTGDATVLPLMKAWADVSTANQINTAACTGVSGATTNFVFYQVYSGIPEGQGCADLDGLTNSRSQNNTVPHAYGYLYLNGQGSTYKTTGDLLFSSDFGYLFGPGADQYNGLAASTVNNGKEYGQAFRSSGHYLAYSTGTVPTVTPLTLYVGARLAGVPNATKYRVTITAPDGAVTTNTCTSSPCTVTADSQQGNSRQLIEYLTTGGTVLASTSSMVVFVIGSGGAPTQLYLSTLTNTQLLTMTDSQLAAMTNPALSWNYLTSSQWSTLTSAQWSALTQ